MQDRHHDSREYTIHRSKVCTRNFNLFLHTSYFRMRRTESPLAEESIFPPPYIYFHGAVHFGMILPMKPSSDAQWFGNLTLALSFCNSPYYLFKLLRKHKLSLRVLSVVFSDQKTVTAWSIRELFSAIALSQKINKKTQDCSDKEFHSYAVLTYTIRPSVRYITIVGSVVLVHLARLVIQVYKITIQR
jgi:hypothetical protein